MIPLGDNITFTFIQLKHIASMQVNQATFSILYKFAHFHVLC